MESLGRFKNLTTLDVVQCPNALNDKILGYISTNMPLLREFGFSHCEEVTDLGITGKNPAGEVRHPGIQALAGKEE